MTSPQTLAVFRARRRAAAGVVAVAAALIAGCGAEPEQPSTAEPTGPPAAKAGAQAATPSAQQSPGETIRLSYGNGRASGDTGRVEVPLGSTVTLVISGAGAGEVHLHGYDRTLQIPDGGGTARLTFTADIPGVFEIERHDAETVLTRLAVR